MKKFHVHISGWLNFHALLDPHKLTEWMCRYPKLPFCKALKDMDESSESSLTAEGVSHQQTPEASGVC
jgi:hypothetical protein